MRKRNFRGYLNDWRIPLCSIRDRSKIWKDDDDGDVICPCLQIVTCILPLCTHKARTKCEYSQHVIISFFFFFFTGATTQCGCWPPSWPRNRRFFRGIVVSFKTNSQHGRAGTILRQALTIWPIWHGWPYQEFILPPVFLVQSMGHANLLSTIRW